LLALTYYPTYTSPLSSFHTSVSDGKKDLCHSLWGS